MRLSAPPISATATWWALASWRRKPGRKRNNMADYKNEFGLFAERPKVEKKLFDRNKVIAGLVIFLVIITIPLWQNLGKPVAAPPPSLDTAVIKHLAEKS